MFAAAGFEHARYIRLLGGIVTIHSGTRPAVAVTADSGRLEQAGVA